MSTNCIHWLDYNFTVPLNLLLVKLLFFLYKLYILYFVFYIYQTKHNQDVYIFAKFQISDCSLPCRMKQAGKFI